MRNDWRTFVLFVTVALILGLTGATYAQGGETLLDALAALEEAGWTFEQISETEWRLSEGDQEITITLSDELPSPSGEPTEVVASLPAADRFNVVPTGNVNLRACASTTCAQVGTASTSQVIEVLAVDTDEQGREWYQFETEDGDVAFIAEWLTKQGPDVRLTQQELQDGYVDLNTNCVLVLEVSRGRNAMAFAITGEAYTDVFIDLYRPNEVRPLNVFGQYPKTFIDTGDMYIHQVYSASYPAGVYTIELTGANGNTSIIEFDYQNTGDALIYALCD
jgi:hypothetical protein